MQGLDYWHPVLQVRDLRDHPVGIKICGKEIVIFRSLGGKIAAIDDRCCHRGMRLSKGRIDQDGCLVCPYHGWRYTLDGRLETSSRPKQTHNTHYYDARQYLGLVWIKSGGSPAALPELDFREFGYVDTIIQQVDAPLEIALDNFTEVEHTGEIHRYFGYAGEETASIQTSTTFTPNTTAVVNKGKQRPMPLLLRLMSATKADDWFFNTWVTYFAPVYTLYDQYWLSADERTIRDLRLRIAIFFNPIDDLRTQLVALVYGRSGYSGLIFRHIVRRVIRSLTRLELSLDTSVVANLADKSPVLHGRMLGRFDQPLIQNRKRIESIYRGKSDDGQSNGCI